MAGGSSWSKEKQVFMVSILSCIFAVTGIGILYPSQTTSYRFIVVHTNKNLRKSIPVPKSLFRHPDNNDQHDLSVIDDAPLTAPDTTNKAVNRLELEIMIHNANKTDVHNKSHVRESATDLYDDMKLLGKPNWRNLSQEFYKLAPEVFDNVPRTFIPEIKNPCWYHPVSKKLQCLPYFNIIGFPKCGTTDLWLKVNKHPQIHHIKLKEPQYWKKRTVGRVDHFQKYVARGSGATSLIEKGFHNIVFGDGSASTVHRYSNILPFFKKNPDGPPYGNMDLIHEMDPKHKMIVIIRNPTERTFSSYLFFKSGRKSPQDFHMETTANIEGFKRCCTLRSEKICTITEKIIRPGDFRIQLSLYITFLKEWYRVFSRDQLMLVTLEDWKANCTSVLPKIYDFLNLDEIDADTIQAHCENSAIGNSNKKAHIKTGDMLPATRSMLDEFYAPYNKNLSIFMNMTLYI